MPPGRPVGVVNQREPVRYGRVLFKVICERLASGQSLNRICRDDGFPTVSAVIQWVMDDKDGCANHYDKARMAQAHYYADEIIDIADDGRNDKHLDDAGNTTSIDYDHINRSTLRVNSRKWVLSKALPKVYGDKLDLNHGGNVDLNVSGISALLAAASAQASSTRLREASGIDEETEPADSDREDD